MIGYTSFAFTDLGQNETHVAGRGRVGILNLVEEFAGSDCRLRFATTEAFLQRFGLASLGQLIAASLSGEPYSELSERLSVRGRFKRQPHVKLCAIRARAEVDFSVMPFDDDSVADHQAESRA